MISKHLDNIKDKLQSFLVLWGLNIQNITPTVLIILPGFGDPYWDDKIAILRKNLEVFNSYNWDYTIQIQHYSLDKQFPPEIKNNPRIKIISEKGILARNIHVHASVNKVKKYDYIMLLLDDVELVSPIDWGNIIATMKSHDLDVVSPCFPSQMSYWDFMVHDPSDPQLMLRVVSKCELFCYLMTLDAYKRYFEFIDPMNPWMWGMDFMLRSHMKLNVGILNQVFMIHHYPRLQDTHDAAHDPRKDLMIYLEKYGINWDELLEQETDILKIRCAS